MVKPGYKQTDLGLLPEEWACREIGSFADVCMCKRIFAEQTTEMGEIPFYKIGTFGKKADAYISRPLFEEYKQKYSYPQKGDVLISAAGTLGRTVVYDGEEAYFQDSNIVWLDIDKSQISNDYLYHYYKVIKWTPSEGSTIARLYNGIITSTNVAVPPKPEQEAIAEALTDIDTLIVNLEKLIAKKKAIKQGAMQELLTGKRRLPGFSGDWTECVLTDVADLMTDTIPVSDIDPRYYVGTDNMVSNRGGVKQNRIELQYSAVRHYMINDILLSNIRPYLKKIWYADTNGGCSSDVLVIRTKNDGKILAGFLYQLLSQDVFFEEVTANAVGTKMPRGDKNVIKAYPLCMPVDLQEQREILKILSEMQVEIENLEKNLNKYKQIKQGMMSELLTGRIRLIDKEDA